MSITWCQQSDFESVIQRQLQQTEVVLDLDCGTRWQTFFAPQELHLCCEVQPEALHVLQNRAMRSPKVVIMASQSRDLLPVMPDKSVDTIFVHDLHETHAESLTFLAQCERIARVQVVVLQGADETNSASNNAGWTVEDFDATWNITAVGDETADASLPITAFCALKTFPPVPTRDLPRKLALVSHDIPPGDSGQAIMVDRLFKDVNRAHYCLISSTDHRAHTFPNNLLPQATDGLRAHFYHIGPKTFHINWKLLHSSSRRQQIRELARAVKATVEHTWQIRRFVKREQCQALLGCSGNVIDLPAAYFASKLAGVPFYAYLFDYYRYQAIVPAYKPFMALMERTVLKGAKTVIVPNTYLANEYQRRYGVQCEVIHNPLDPTLLHEADGDQEVPLPVTEGEVKILYTGQVYDAHYDAFVDLVQALEALNDPISKLHIYTAQPVETLKQSGIRGEAVVFHPHQPQSRIRLLQRQADILFLPLAFHSPYPEIIKTSAPSKMAEYLASGRPILAHVPEKSFVSWYFTTYQCGLVVEQKDPQLLVEALQRLRSDAALRQMLVKNARERAKIDFDLQTARDSLFNILQPES